MTVNSFIFHDTFGFLGFSPVKFTAHENTTYKLITTTTNKNSKQKKGLNHYRKIILQRNVNGIFFIGFCWPCVSTNIEVVPALWKMHGNKIHSCIEEKQP